MSYLLFKPRGRAFALFVSVGLSLSAAPGTGHSLTLEQALSFSLAHDPEFLGAQSALVASQERRAQAQRRLGPSLSADLEARRVDIAPQPSGPDISLNQRSYAVTLRQPVYNPGLSRGLTQAEQRLRATEAVLVQAQQDAILRLVSAYFDILVAQDSHATVRAEKAAISEQLALAQRSFEVGTATITDQQEAQARFDLTAAREIAAQNQLNIARNALALLTRQPTPEALQGFGSGARIPSPEPQDLQVWVNAAREKNPAVVRSRMLAEAAKIEISRRTAADLPSVGLTASHSRSWETTLPSDEQRRNLVGLLVSIPIVGGPVPAEIREASALAEEEAYRAESAQLAAEQNARAAFLSVMAGLAQVAALEAAERSSQLALASNKLGYEVGVRINIDVLNAQQQLFAAQRDLSKARYDTLLAGLRLKAAAGQLQSSDIARLSNQARQ
ncbi:MAG: TolC family outer membrane protein [Burkholderiaceae bacterium]